MPEPTADFADFAETILGERIRVRRRTPVSVFFLFPADSGENSLRCFMMGWSLRKRRGSGDSPGLQNRRLAPCGVNGAFDSHTLPPTVGLLRLGLAASLRISAAGFRCAHARSTPQVRLAHASAKPLSKFRKVRLALL